MKLLATAPERDNQLSLNEHVQVLADALAGHVEVTTKFIQSLAIALAKLIQQGAAAGIGQGFENVVHAR